MMVGIRPILDDVEYQGFVFDAYRTNDNFFFVYVGHVGIEGWFNEEENQEDEHDSCIEGMENI